MVMPLGLVLGMGAGARELRVVIIARVLQLLLHPYLGCVISQNRSVLDFTKKLDAGLVERFVVFRIGERGQKFSLLLGRQGGKRLAVSLEAAAVHPRQSFDK